MITVSPPDLHGFCSLGTSVDIARAAVDTARIVIAQKALIEIAHPNHREALERAFYERFRFSPQQA